MRARATRPDSPPNEPHNTTSTPNSAISLLIQNPCPPAWRWTSSSREGSGFDSMVTVNRGAGAKTHTRGRSHRRSTALPGRGHVVSCVLGPRRADRRLDVLALLRGREHGREAEGLQPKLTCPTGRVIEVLVLVAFHLVARRGERLGGGARRLVGNGSEKLPVEMVLRLGEDDRLAGDELCRLGRAGR